MIDGIVGQLNLPPMRMVHQQYRIPAKVDVLTEINKQWEKLGDNLDLPIGSRIAIAVGSRGIASITEVIQAIVKRIREAGCKPFIIPAMGSHGGATAEGQIKILSALGISEKSVGAPINATMEVTCVGEHKGIPLFLDKLAHEAEGIVLVNRIKQHTDFDGPTQSGLIKMMAIGLGNQIGAEYYHRLSMVKNMYDIISTSGKALLKRSKVLFGVGLVENQNHQLAFLRMALCDELEDMEKALLKKAEKLILQLPLDAIDLLIIDEMGKDISGAGMDPRVTGRITCGYVAVPRGPDISRIFVRDLTPACQGCATGIGQADFTTRRLVDKIDFDSTLINCLTSCCPEDGRIPLAFESDREAIAAALVTIRPFSLEDLRILHIRNTLKLETMMASKGCLSELRDRAQIYIAPEDLSLDFDQSGNLISLLTDVD